MHSSKSNTKDPEYGIFRIRYSSKEAKSPVYIAGTFTNPPWQLIEMDSLGLETSDESKFEIRLDLAKGQDYEYKFRIGRDDHWILNDEEPIVQDEAGNLNNLLPTERNKLGWREKKNTSDRSGEVLEERMLTKFTAEERSKVLETSLANNYQQETKNEIPINNSTSTHAVLKKRNDNTEQQQIQPTSHNTDDLRKYISDIKITDTGIMVPEVPRDPVPTPPADMKRFNGLAEIKFEDLKQNNMQSLSNSPKINKKQSSHENFKHNFKNESNPTVEGSEKKITRQQVHNLDIANTAAEVADMAAILDQEPCTPPVSDVEAGQIGLRRLSMTPIAEVARVAAEVADVAASLDDEQATDKTPRQLLDENAERLFGSGHTTPVEERVPRFSHEFPTFQDPSGPRKSQSDIIIPSLPKREEIPDDFDMNDPSIELFPTDRASILAKLKEIQERLPEDEAFFESVPAPSVILPEDWSMKKFETTSANNFNGQPSKSLQPITEEEDSKSEESQIQLHNRNEKSSMTNGPTLQNNGSLFETEPNTSLNGKKIENNLKECDKINVDSRQIGHEIKILQDNAVLKTDLNDTKISNDNGNPSCYPIMSNGENDESPTQLQPSITSKDGLPNLNKSQEENPDNLINITKLNDKLDTVHTKNYTDQAISTGKPNANASCTMLRRSKSFQKIKADNQVTHETEKETRIRSFLNLIWRLLFFDWIGNTVKWLWGTSKHDT
ncbi:putative pt repeat family protein [Erysiphe neolycopersici]|uniref:Putative pt repeat family protein n=1 Tax=Erysiphe neolycopersici TaxID=212602 RepID=A0A420HHW3_9PEZI|nr:putative pt repeat family protein [Erysiphe neolycopersici]